MMVGDPALHLDAFILEPEFAAVDYPDIAVTDLAVLERGGPPEIAPSWVDRGLNPLRPTQAITGGWRYRPAVRRVYSTRSAGSVSRLSSGSLRPCG